MKFLSLSLLLVLMSALVYAQHWPVQGRVLDADTSQPLPFANVYLNNTTISATTADDGSYSLQRIPPGEYELIVSYVGYEKYQQRIVVKDTSSQLITIRLKGIQLKDIEITSSRDKKWEKQLDYFKKFFFGPYARLDLIRIVNPYSLNFEENNKGVFFATSQEPLEIDNFYLGYHITYTIINFAVTPDAYSITGNMFFREMLTMDPLLKARWNENRKQTYEGSVRHFLKSFLQGRVEQSGFKMYAEIGNTHGERSDIFYQNLDKTVKPYIPESGAIDSLRENGVYKLKLPAKLEVHYLNKKYVGSIYKDVPHPVSALEVKGTLEVTKAGVVVNYSDMTVAGEWSEHRVADALPFDYHPGIEYRTVSSDTVNEAKSYFLIFIEKPYLHTDRSYYYANDNLYFKAYMNYRALALRDSLSHILYVDLVDQNKKIVATSTLFLSEGCAAGAFKISPLFPAGNYTLRAYTRWMQNYKSDLIFHKPIRLLGYNEVVLPKSDAKVFNSRGIDIRTTKQVYSPREKIELEVSTSDTIANLSIAVTDMQQVIQAINEPEILQNFPITQNDISDLPTALHYKVQDGIDIAGQFVNKKGQPTEEVLNITEKNSAQSIVTSTDRDGKFLIENVHFYDSSEFLISAQKTGNMKGGKIVIHPSSVSPVVKSITPLDVRVATVDQKTFSTRWVPESFDDAQTLNEVVVEDVRIEKPKVVPFANYNISGDRLRSMRVSNLIIPLQGMVAGLRIYSALVDGIVTQVVMLGVRHLSFKQRELPDTIGSPPLVHEPLILINDLQANFQPGDGVRVLSWLRPDEIEHIEIYKTNGYTLYGALGSFGVIKIYTRDPVNYPRPKPVNNNVSLQQVKLKGITKPLIFKSPDYSLQDSLLSTHDYRATIFWEPELKVSRTPTRISFYAADSPTRYRVLIEGVTAEGAPVMAEKIIDIQPGN
jgi:hypothetical protein